MRHICVQALGAVGSWSVQLIWMLRNTRSGCGIMAVKRPSAVVTADEKKESQLPKRSVRMETSGTFSPVTI